MTEDRWGIWIKKTVTEPGYLPTHLWERVGDESFSEEDCKERVKKLNGGNPDGPYSCGLLDGLILS
jgi:hypothetical protein